MKKAYSIVLLVASVVHFFTAMTPSPTRIILIEKIGVRWLRGFAHTRAAFL
jgi:hypothetical protein